MPAVTIRDVPVEARNELAARAARAGQSLQEFLRSTLIELAARPDLDAVLDDIAAARRRSGAHLSAEQILEFRDEGRR